MQVFLVWRIRSSLSEIDFKQLIYEMRMYIAIGKFCEEEEDDDIQ
jgi:hypothetical protein